MVECVSSTYGALASNQEGKKETKERKKILRSKNPRSFEYTSTKICGGTSPTEEAHSLLPKECGSSGFNKWEDSEEWMHNPTI